MPDTNGDLSLREASRLIEAQEQRWQAHMREHAAHDREHGLTDENLDTRFKAHQDIHHEHAVAHDREHSMTAEALHTATASLDKRLEAMNEFRDQLREQAGRFAGQDALNALQREMDRRMSERDKTLAAKIDTVTALTIDKYEANRQRIEMLEKGDVKQEGKSLGQGTVVALIVGAVTFVGAILGIVIVFVNLLTAA